MKIYLVEDSTIILQRLRDMLETVPNARVVGTAHNADDAIRGIEALAPDVALIDLHLAKGTGFDVLRALREKASGVEVFVLSEFATPACRRHAADLGAADFFDKSTEFQMMRARVAECAALREAA